jgi:hypothetical protein
MRYMSIIIPKVKKDASKAFHQNSIQTSSPLRSLDHIKSPPQATCLIALVLRGKNDIVLKV